MKKYIFTFFISSAAVFADFNLDDIQMNPTEIDNALGDIDKIIEEIAGYDLDSILKNIGMDNELMGCLTQDVDLSKFLGEIPSADGVCGLIQTGFNPNDLLNNPIAKCAGIDIDMPEDIKNMQNRFEGFCNGKEKIPKGGGEDEILKVKKAYSPIGSVSADIESGSVSGGVKTSASSRPLEDKTYPSGLTVGDLYSNHGGGKLYNTLFIKPDGADANAIKTNNKNALILKDMALKLTGNTNENDIHLPEDQLSVMKDENDVANLISLGEIDYYELENNLITAARNKFSELEANSLNEYYIKEKKEYQQMISEDTEVQQMIANIKENAMNAIGNYYNMKLIQLKNNKNYLTNTSYTVERIMKPEAKDKFKVQALLQQNDEALIKSNMAIAKRKVNMKIDKTVQQAYYKASIFRADIAKKEIDTILKAVDVAIH